MNQYRISCTAVVNGEPVVVSQMVDIEAYDTDPALREYANASVRAALAVALVEKWKPKIDKDRMSGDYPSAFLAG